MTAQLRVDWPACRGHGLCHELLPDKVRLDEWGYPVVGDPVGAEELPDARAAVAACPRRALRLVSAPAPAPAAPRARSAR